MVEPLFCNINRKSTIFRYISSLFQVCVYFILENDKLIIVDPGKLNQKVIEWLKKHDELNKVIYVTHEHFDHHYHANEILNLKNSFLNVPSESFKDSLRDPKKNLSYYYNDPIQTISTSIMDVSHFEVIKTPGHSKESHCFIYEDVIFGGDTIIDSKYLVFKLPGGDREQFENSLRKIMKIVCNNSIVLPGHGDYFFLNSWNL